MNKEQNHSTSNFNLLPKEVFDSRAKKKEVFDRTSLLAALLPMFGVMVWISFVMGNYFVQTQIQEIYIEIEQVQSDIDGMQDIKDQKSLLVLKTRVLQDIVIRDVNPENFFDIVSDTIRESNLDISIESYGRNSDGKFFIRGLTSDFGNATAVTRIFRNVSKIENIQLVQIGKIENDFQFEIRFNL